MMIVPANRLVVFVLAASAPLVAASAAAPAWTGLAAGLCAVFIAAAAADALLSARRLRGMTVELPPVSRLWKDRQGRLPVTVERTTRNPGEVTVALALPVSIETPLATTRVHLPGDADRSTFDWPVIPRKRGRYPVPVAALEVGSFLGFWRVRSRIPLDNAVIQVYPDLLKDRKTMAALFLHRGGVGLRRVRQVGRGREFERLRDYMPGDSFGDIHWKTTAKRGRPVTKEFQVERTQEVYTIIDASRLSARILEQAGRDGKAEEVLEHFVRAALILGMAAQRQGDLFGLTVFADRVQTFIRAGRGTSHFNVCREAVYRTMPQLVSPDFRELFAFLRLRLRRRSLLVFLTDLDDPVLAEEFTDHLHLLTRRHVVFVAMVQPSGALPAFSGPPVSGPDEIPERLAGHLRWRRLRELQREIRRKGAGFGLLPHDHMSLELVSQYVEIKQRQLL